MIDRCVLCDCQGKGFYFFPQMFDGKWVCLVCQDELGMKERFAMKDDGEVVGVRPY